jgi:hypothetical protein
MSFDRRLERLEEALEMETDGPSLEARLREALEVARERRRQGEEPADDESPCGEGPIWARFARARQRAAEARHLLGL